MNAKLPIPTSPSSPRPYLLKCKDDGEDVEARFKCQMAVRYAMEKIRAGVPMGGSHAIGHQLGPLGVPHGVTSCIMCPAVIKFNIKHGAGKPEIVRRQEMIREILWADSKVMDVLRGGGLDPISNDLGDALEVIVRFLELPRALSAFDIAADKIPASAKNALEDFWARTNSIPLVEAAQVEEILNMVM
ncbi:hypothetical protein OPT61_g3366 [Boeremia exigua]|uniref:Uncharacterized protein n=1 Tax=Boeremia exigua TaxID=749465 RepID=A0ACC2II50_9PLEO|nr:hypothetical protein OPT61_g3366 [Boeremia exigua]